MRRTRPDEDERQREGPTIRVVHQALAWAGFLALWTTLACVLNAAALRAFSADSHTDDSTPGSALYVSECRGNPACDSQTRDPCALDADGGLYAYATGWLPAGRSARCSDPTDHGGATPSEMARRAGRIQATITYVGRNESRLVLYCQTTTHLLPSQARDLSVEEVRTIYDEVCTGVP